MILLVEDSPIFGTLVKSNLEKRLSESIYWAQSFAAAKKIIDERAEDIDVALLDLSLPDCDMGEVVDYAISHEISSIVFTSRFDIQMHKTIWGKGVVDYVLKDGPDSLNYLAQQIQRLRRNHKYKILVVDDSPMLRKLICRLLTIHRFPTVTANNGVEALQVLEQHPDINLILTDYNMPEMDGFELTRTLRRHNSQENLAIIGLSAQGDRHVSAKFIKHGANDFIAKPFYAEEFYCRVNLNIDNMERVAIIRDSSHRDYLTGLHNRRYFFSRMARIFPKAKQLCVAMVDIDFFKAVNDNYGHDVGDTTLCVVADLLRRHLPEDALIARFGGEEFCLGLCDRTDMAVFDLLEQLRLQVENTTISAGDNTFNITISIGVCCKKMATIDEMIATADELLYNAKQQGRNCTKVLE